MIEAARHDTIGDSAYRHIRDDIIFGQLRPSEKLRLEPLRKRYNVSVTTLREILNRLTSDGLVVAEGQKGFEVASVSDADLWEVAELRMLVEATRSPDPLPMAIWTGNPRWSRRITSCIGSKIG